MAHHVRRPLVVFPRTSESAVRPRSRSRLAIVAGLAMFAAGFGASCALVQKPNARRAAALIQGRVLEDLTGVAVFLEVPGGTRVSVSVQNAPPGAHGVFVCQGATCADAREHLNPTRASHGSRASGSHHAGDLGNLLVDDNGVGSLELVVDDLSVNDPETSVVGKVLVISERADDFTTQPNGASGAKLACGAIYADRR